MTAKSPAAEDRTRFRLITEHVDSDQPGDDNFHEWIRDRRSVPLYLSADGREIQAGAYRWRALTCNNTGCPARALWRLDLIEREAAAWEARRK